MPETSTPAQHDHDVRVQYISGNQAGRDLVVGDLHGCRSALDRGLQALQFDPAVDRVLSVGDLVDRGPDSPGSLALLREPWFHAVMGNHEAMLVTRFLSSDRDLSATDMHRMNGGTWYRGPEQLTEDPGLASLIELAVTLPHLLVVGTGPERYHLVHAELPEGQSTPVLTDAEIDSGALTRRPDAFMWSRQFMAGKVAVVVPQIQRGLSTTYCGHTPESRVRRRRSHVCLDTGACFAHQAEARQDFALTIAERLPGGGDRIHQFTP